MVISMRYIELDNRTKQCYDYVQLALLTLTEEQKRDCMRLLVRWHNQPYVDKRKALAAARRGLLGWRTQ